MRSLSVYRLELRVDLDATAGATSQVACSVPFSGKCIGVVVSTPATIGGTGTTLTIERARGTLTFVSLFASDPALPTSLVQGGILAFTPDQNANLQDGDVLRVTNVTDTTAATNKITVQFFIDSDSDANPTGFNALLPNVSRSIRPLSLIPWTVGVDHTTAASVSAAAFPTPCKVIGIQLGFPIAGAASTLTVARIRAGAGAGNLFSVAPTLSTSDLVGTSRLLVPNQNNDMAEGDSISITNSGAVTNMRLGWVFLLATGEGG